jgi:hypothetical protein
MVSLKVYHSEFYNFDCGGALIHPQFVLTGLRIKSNKLVLFLKIFYFSAAHCIKSEEDKVILSLGELDLNTDPDCVDNVCNDPVVQVEAAEIIVHEKYQEPNYENDIALLKLDRAVKYSDNIKPLCLPVNVPLSNYTGQTLVAAGWGE